MSIDRFTVYARTIKEVAAISKCIRKLPKETLRSLEDLESTENIGIDSPVSVENLIRIYPVEGEIIDFKGPRGSKYYPNQTRFDYKGKKYTVFNQIPPWLKKDTLS